jgi:flavin-dependent thymidylate synthase
MRRAFGRAPASENMMRMDVRLVTWTPSPELLAAAAARPCYRDISAVDLLRELSAEEVDHLLDVILTSGHLSVVEHITFTFAIDGVSRVLTHQLVRHRVGVAYSQPSSKVSGRRSAARSGCTTQSAPLSEPPTATVVPAT